MITGSARVGDTYDGRNDEGDTVVIGENEIDTIAHHEQVKVQEKVGYDK